MAPRIGVVTVLYNSESFINGFAKSCTSQSEERYRVYCIDNRSADLSVATARRYADSRWTIHPNDRNVGVAAGNNQGIYMAMADGCEWILLLNNDTTFPPGFFEVLLRQAHAKQARVVVPKITYDTPAHTIWYGGGHFVSHRGYTGAHAGKDQPDDGRWDEDKTVDYAPTCAMLVHASVFTQMGVMDEDFFVYFDDTDFCWRLRLARIAIHYTAHTQLTHHVGGSTGGAVSPFTAWITARNRVHFVRKHHGTAAAIAWIPLFLLYYIGQLGLQRDGRRFRASITGTFAFARMGPPVATNDRK